ncbi:DUF6103 family protein [Caproicibacter fermentans]|uniref:DUF6103 family protein n=1 Tax=Caproicibacter fermentans TaxID=2576756 RepID=UPI00226B1E22|nr:DUF6103 family protein [Caproicibacter fermentans]
MIDLEKFVTLVCNEEAKLIGMEGNRSLGNDIIAGTFLLQAVIKKEISLRCPLIKSSSIQKNFRLRKHLLRRKLKTQPVFGLSASEQEGDFAMRKETLTVRFNSEKLQAIRQYMRKKDADLNEELDAELQKLYENTFRQPSGNILNPAISGKPPNIPKRRMIK